MYCVLKIIISIAMNQAYVVVLRMYAVHTRSFNYKSDYSTSCDNGKTTDHVIQWQTCEKRHLSQSLFPHNIMS